MVALLVDVGFVFRRGLEAVDAANLAGERVLQLMGFSTVFVVGCILKVLQELISSVKILT